ncbi:hypothetical protein HPB47_018527 [Ixodes persulcatus]|uniref:Uncharacterized protein n=1 Tax=Ixodes persulcatus TaxID=34615 RepID=A0AC60QLC0_IXOPE|nr:hypothetical protein HPB47_018527 [Ixodes persulcatus]
MMGENAGDDIEHLVANKRRRKRPKWYKCRIGRHNSSGKHAGNSGVRANRRILKPICKENVKNFTAREIRRAVAEAGITLSEDYKIQIQPRANTIALTTRDEKITEKLLQVTEVKKDKDSYALKPYKAMGHNQVRGVIYLHGDNSAETPETLVPDLVCRTAKIVFARLMGKTSNAVVITFEGTRLPKNVMFSREIFTVRPYHQRPIVCYNCHGIGHKSDVCPIKESRCGHCGYTHEEDIEQCNREPKCRNCEGHHVATSNACPKRKIPEKTKLRKQPPTHQPRESYAAAATDNRRSPAEQPRVEATQGSTQGMIHEEQGKCLAWMPEWAQPRATQVPATRPLKSPFDAETEHNKLREEMSLGFKMIFQTLGEIKKEIAELRHERR